MSDMRKRLEELSKELLLERVKVQRLESTMSHSNQSITSFVSRDSPVSTPSKLQDPTLITPSKHPDNVVNTPSKYSDNFGNTPSKHPSTRTRASSIRAAGTGTRDRRRTFTEGSDKSVIPQPQTAQMVGSDIPPPIPAKLSTLKRGGTRGSGISTKGQVSSAGQTHHGAPLRGNGQAGEHQNREGRSNSLIGENQTREGRSNSLKPLVVLSLPSSLSDYPLNQTREGRSNSLIGEHQGPINLNNVPQPGPREEGYNNNRVLEVYSKSAI
eukprot:sb/3468193/